MTERSLARLLRPRSVATLGGGWAAEAVAQCLKAGFEGPIWPIHPTKTTVHGVPCLRTLADLPAAPDAVFIGINRHATVDAVGALADMGAGGAVCFASGFAEAAAGALQADLVAAAGPMPILGPNCYGFINYLDGALLWPDQHGGKRVERGVALITQSSNILINLTMQRRGLPIAYCLTAGNQAQTGLAELARAVLDDPRVTAIGLHIEGIGDVRAFEALAAEARNRAIPIVALKIGASEQARAATLSHTASLAGDAEAGSALLARLGIAEIRTLPELIETLKLLHVHGPLPGARIASLSCSGGEASLVADAAARRGISLPALSADESRRVAATLSDLVAIANPLDYHTFIWDDVPRMADTYAAMMASDVDLTMLILDLPRLDRCSDTAWRCAPEALRAAISRTGARAALVATLPETLPEAEAEALAADGIAPLAGIDEALAAIEAAAFLGTVTVPEAPVLLGTADAANAVLLTEAEAKAALAVHGIAVPRRIVSASRQAITQADIPFPVVLKAQGLAHKTEAGAVRIGLANAEALMTAAAAMPKAPSYLVEEMIEDGVAEILVGIVHDPAHGTLMTLGAGGVLTEILDDTASLLVPASRDAVARALASLRISAVLSGYRGKAPAATDRLIDLVMGLQAFVVAHADRVTEVEVNPVIVTPTRAVAVDALIRMTPES